MLIHLDTDFAGDTDDACALAMLLGWPDAELTAVTTTADPDGARAGYVNRFLALAGRDDVPVAAGAGTSGTTGAPMGTMPDHDVYWGGEPAAPRPSPQGAAIELLAGSVDRGATILAIGPYTNLADLEGQRPGALRRALVVLMGGWVRSPDRGLPPWGPEMDWNIQCDTNAALTVLHATEKATLVTLPATLHAHLRGCHLDRLAATGPLGQLLAHQAQAHAAEHHMAALGRAHHGLPDDLLNFQYDPVAAAVALGWEGAAAETMTLRPVVEQETLRFEPADDGFSTRVVTHVDGQAFAEMWLATVERADSWRRST